MGTLFSILIANNVFYYLLIDNYFIIELSSFWGYMLFISLTAISYLTGLYILSSLDRQINAQAKSNQFIFYSRIYKVIRIIYYANALLLVIIIFQILTVSHYSIILSIVIMACSFTIATIVSGVLSYKFFLWYKSKHNITILIYAEFWAECYWYRNNICYIYRYYING